MPDTLLNKAQDVMTGFGTAGNDGGSSVNVNGFASAVASGTATATAVSTGTANKGYIRIGATALGGGNSFLTMLVTVTDGTLVASVYAEGAIPASANNGLTRLIPWESDMAVNQASVTFTQSAGTPNVTIELCGNVGQPPAGTSTL